MNYRMERCNAEGFGRPELNRQIKADNALLRELKATVRKLMQAVRNTVPAMARALEELRANMIIFQYSINRARTGKRKFSDWLKSAKEIYADYTDTVKQLKGCACNPDDNRNLSINRI